MAHDQEAKNEIVSLPVGKRKGFVYDASTDAIAVGNTIHMELARKISSKGGCAGFFERTVTNFIWIIHWPQSPADIGGKELLPKVIEKLKALGFSADVKR